MSYSAVYLYKALPYRIFDKNSKKDHKFKTKYTFTPPCIQAILENGAEEGQRNITIACLAGFCKNYGKSLNESIDFIIEWNSKNIKPTPEQELRRTVRSIFMGEKQFGCSTLKTITVCKESECKLAKSLSWNSYQIYDTRLSYA